MVVKKGSISELLIIRTKKSTKNKTTHSEYLVHPEMIST